MKFRAYAFASDYHRCICFTHLAAKISMRVNGFFGAVDAGFPQNNAGISHFTKETNK
jgi:hypothetical protein